MNCQNCSLDNNAIEFIRYAPISKTVEGNITSYTNFKCFKLSICNTCINKIRKDNLLVAFVILSVVVVISLLLYYFIPFAMWLIVFLAVVVSLNLTKIFFGMSRKDFIITGLFFEKYKESVPEISLFYTENEYHDIK